MLAQSASVVDPGAFERLLNGLVSPQAQHPRLQEAAMSIRMMPSPRSFLFFFVALPRVVRDLARSWARRSS
ncbi:MAG: hypothetical protein IPM03_04470 [Sulfuritalea sp.]|nr:hypothetical protein [Sulfuritalea sp.]